MNKMKFSEDWAVKVEGKPTAYYVLVNFESEIIGNRADYKSIQRYWDKRLLPLINDKPLETITKADVEEILAKIQNNANIRSERKGEYEQYDPSTVNQMRGMIKRLFMVAENNGICEDIYWGHNSSSTVKGDKNEKKKRLPKSLSPKIEERIVKEVLSDAAQNGETWGIALMYSMGLRNSEAAAQVFGNLIQINGRYYLSSHVSMDPELTIVRLGGKTYNMYRLIPVREKCLEKLLERMKFIQDKIDSEEIKLDGKNGIKSISQMPIACKGTNYLVHCTSRDLTKEGRRILHKVELDQEIYNEAMAEAQISNNILLFGEEKDGTAYLFRRNEGEHLKDAGCTDSEIQYYLGHVIVEDNFERHDFVNPDLLESLAEKLAQRPLLSKIKANEHIMQSGSMLSIENTTKTSIQIPLNGKKYRITITPEQWHEPVQVVFQPKQKRNNPHEIQVSCKQKKRPQVKAEKDIVVSEVDVTYDYKKRFHPKYVQDNVIVE